MTGSITGTDLGPITNPEAYGTSILIDTATGATIGFQMISPIVAQPIPFSAPFDTSTIDPTATYVARGSVWDGTTLWNTPTGTAVITKDNPKSGVVLTVVPAVTTAQPAEDPGRTWLPWILLLIAVGIGIARVPVVALAPGAGAAGRAGDAAPAAGTGHAPAAAGR